jgi:hypothetical protein
MCITTYGIIKPTLNMMHKKKVNEALTLNKFAIYASKLESVDKKKIKN